MLITVGKMLTAASIILVIAVLLIYAKKGIFQTIREYKLLKEKGYVGSHEKKKERENIYHQELKRKPQRKRTISKESRAILRDLAQRGQEDQPGKDQAGGAAEFEFVSDESPVYKEEQEEEKPKEEREEIKTEGPQKSKEHTEVLPPPEDPDEETGLLGESENRSEDEEETGILQEQPDDETGLLQEQPDDETGLLQDAWDDEETGLLEEDEEETGLLSSQESDDSTGLLEP